MRSIAIILQVTGLVSVALGLAIALAVERDFGEATVTLGLVVLIFGLLAERGW